MIFWIILETCYAVLSCACSRRDFALAGVSSQIVLSTEPKGDIVLTHYIQRQTNRVGRKYADGFARFSPSYS